MNEDNNKTIYVGNLEENVSTELLARLFITFGEIKSIEIPSDHVSKKPRGFAFVEFFEESDADQAIDNLDEAEYLGKIIKVKKSKPMKNRLQNNRPIWSDDQWFSRAGAEPVGNPTPEIIKKE